MKTRRDEVKQNIVRCLLREAKGDGTPPDDNTHSITPHKHTEKVRL